MSNAKHYRWSFIDHISIALINFSVNIVLVHMLTAADFGLLAMIGIFTAVAMDLSSCGLSDGLVHKSHPTELDFSTVFIFNAGMGLVFGLSFFFGAPLVARFFGHEELVLVMRCLGVCFFFQSMSYVQETRLRKQLDMKKICLVRVGATVTVSIMGIVAAYLGMGYKALICTQIFLSFFFFLYYTIASRWFPRIQFSRKSFKELFGYGVHLMLAYLSTLVGKNINTSVLGRFYASSALSGFYYQGAKLANVPFSVIEGSVNFPFFAIAANEEDAERRRKLLDDMYTTMLSLSGTLCLVLLALSAPVIEFIYGDKWIGAIPVFRILAIAEMFICLRGFFQTVCKVHGRTSFIRNMGFCELGVQLALLAVFCRSGIVYIAWTQTAAVSVAICIYAFYTRRFVGLRLRTLVLRAIEVLWLPVLAGAVAFGSTYTVGDAQAWLRTAVGGVAYVLIFIGLGEVTGSPAYITLKKKLFAKAKGE